MYRVPQILCFTSLVGVRPCCLFLAWWYGCCFGQRAFHIAWYPPLLRAEDWLSLPLRIAAVPSRFSCSEVRGPPVLVNYYVASVISCGPGGPVKLVTPPGLSLILQCLLGAPWSPSGHAR